MKITVTALGLEPERFEDCCSNVDVVVSVHNYKDRTVFAVECDNCDMQIAEVEV